MDSGSYVDEGDDYAGFSEASAEKPNFDRADLKYAQARTSSQFKIEFLSFISNLPVTYRLKRDLYSVIYTLFSPEQVLANNNPRAEPRFFRSDPLEKKLLSAELQIAIAIASTCTKSDSRKINTMLLQKEILDSFEAYVSRSIGSDREGIRNSIITTESMSRLERPRSQEVVNNKKKSGILNFGGN